MIKTLIKTYHTIHNKSKLKLIEELLGNENYFRQEVNFFDDGRVAAGINRINEDYKKLLTEIEFVKDNYKDDEDKIERLNFLYGRQYEFLKTITFQASQNFKNIDNCINMLGNIKNDFSLCLEGLKAYSSGNKDEAFSKLTAYLKLKNSFEDHYLLNKIYGTMLYEKNSYDEAEPYLYKITQICPEDLEVHNMMKNIYHTLGNSNGEFVEQEIISILGAE